MQHYAFRLIVALLTFILGLASTSVLNAFRPAPVSDGKAEQEILQMERRYIRAHLERDTVSLNNILADEFTISTRYRVSDKAQRLELVMNPDFAFESINTSGVEVEANGDTATVTGEAFVKVRYQDREYTSPLYRFTRRYEKRQGDWQIVSVQITR